ncbi:lysin [Weissella phage PWc]|nr:lysin [Weissella phage PWc]
MVNVKRNIVVPGRPLIDNGSAQAPFYGVHLHSTANPNAPMKNEAAFLARNWTNGFYTHLVGWNPDTGKAEAWQVAEKNAGSWDTGGSANLEAYASIEFSEFIPNQDAFNQAYKVYIDLARQLVKEIKGDYRLNDGSYTGLETHKYISETGRGSDHVDPIGFLARWGVSEAQFKKDLLNGYTIHTKPVEKEYKVNQVVELKDWARIYNEQDKLVLPDEKKDNVVFAKGTRVTLKKRINKNLWEVDYYGMNFKGVKPHLRQGNFK